MTKKLFWIVIKINFFITNSNNQELIHHAYCLGYVFYHYYVKTRQRNVVNSIGSYSAIFTVDSIIEFFKHLSFKKIYLYSPRLFLQQQFYWHPLIFYAYCYHLLRINTHSTNSLKRFWRKNWKIYRKYKRMFINVLSQ